MTDREETFAKVAELIEPFNKKDIELIGKELDTIRQEIRDSLGEDDAKYIRTVIDVPFAYPRTDRLHEDPRFGAEGDGWLQGALSRFSRGAGGRC